MKYTEFNESKASRLGFGTMRLPMDAEGKIYCKCSTDDNGRSYNAEITSEGVRVTCKKCGASRTIPTDSRLSAHAFLNADALYLE